MPKGKVDIIFKGGYLDGTIEQGVSSLNLMSTMSFCTGMQLVASPDILNMENVSIYKTEREHQFILKENWLSYGVDIYKKESKNKAGLWVYRFKLTDSVNRCEALNKSNGKPCLHKALKKSTFCGAHKIKR